ncbi:MAG: cation diffusion facilitator family transporter, partial [Vicinamibacterales bacterium]
MASAEGTSVLTRSAAVSRVLTRVLAANLAVAIAKLVFGYATATVSILSDGFHSLTDAAANVVALVGLRASRKPPDVDHPYGHRKYETLTAAAIVALLVLAIAEVVRTSLAHIGGSAPRVTGASFAIIIATLVVNLAVVG